MFRKLTLIMKFLCFQICLLHCYARTSASYFQIFLQGIVTINCAVLTSEIKAGVNSTDLSFTEFQMFLQAAVTVDCAALTSDNKVSPNSTDLSFTEKGMFGLQSCAFPYKVYLFCVFLLYNASFLFAR